MDRTPRKVKPEEINWETAGRCARQILSLIEKAGFVPPELYGRQTKVIAELMNDMGTALCMLPPKDGLST